MSMDTKRRTITVWSDAEGRTTLDIRRYSHTIKAYQTYTYKWRTYSGKRLSHYLNNLLPKPNVGLFGEVSFFEITYYL